MQIKRIENQDGSFTVTRADAGKILLVKSTKYGTLRMAHADAVIESVRHTDTWKGLTKAGRVHYNGKSRGNKLFIDVV